MYKNNVIKYAYIQYTFVCHARVTGYKGIKQSRG